MSGTNKVCRNSGEMTFYFQADSQNIVSVRSLSNREREAPIINAKCWQRSHWSRRRDSCVLHLWTAGVLRQLVTLQPLMGGVGRGLAREQPDCPTVPRPLSLSLTLCLFLCLVLLLLLNVLFILSTINIDSFGQIEIDFCGDNLHPGTEREDEMPNTWINHVT